MLRGTADRTVTYLAVVMLWMPPKLVCSLSERECIKDMLKAKDAVSGRSSPVLEVGTTTTRGSIIHGALLAEECSRAGLL